MKAARLLTLSLGLVILANFGSGLLEQPPTAGLPVAHAYACRAANPSCPPSITWRTASVDGSHLYEAYTQPVEPEDGETFAITAYWNTANVPCAEIVEVAYATVSRSGGGWAVSNVTPTANITNIVVCSGDACGSQEDNHAWSYRLIAQVNDPVPASFNLRQVVFTTTSVDDGYAISPTTCSVGTAVSPTSQSFTATDSGMWECGYSCDYSGTSLEITYE
jgi:hypothetical protein